jgi:CubicO group peptidase (beta-lactamase class C family)
VARKDLPSNAVLEELRSLRLGYCFLDLPRLAFGGSIQNRRRLRPESRRRRSADSAYRSDPRRHPIGENEPPLRLNIVKLMEIYKVPGLSIAVIDNFRIVWAKAYGVIEAGSTTAVTPRTLFQAGSISKPVAATGALYLVEHGKLSLDENVNQKLKTWKVPENEFTKNEKVTLRRLMSHSAGLTVHGFPGYDVNDPVPTLVQILNGEKPANTAPIRVDFVPGTRVRYSGGGVTIEQQLVMDVTGKAFPDLMRETVLSKIGMVDSTYEQPLPPAKAAQTASGTRADGKVVHGRWHIYPEMAAAGLWTTPTDLSKFAIEIALSRQGKSNLVLSETMTREMLTPVLEEAGLGFFLDKNNPGYFEHNGADEGFQAILTMSAESGKGAAIMANSDNGITVGNFLLESIAKEYGWNYKLTEHGPFPGAGAHRQAQGYASRARAAHATQKIPAGGPPGCGEYTQRARLGYTLLSSGQTEDAIAVFRGNVQEYPKSANVLGQSGRGVHASRAKGPRDSEL